MTTQPTQKTPAAAQKPQANQKSYYQGTGRRKTSTAQVRLTPGSGTVIIDGKPMQDRFPQPQHQTTIQQPLQALDLVKAYNVMVKVNGGGISGQAGAIRHGIARALLEVNPAFRPTLKKAGFLTRDPRAKERKKYGLKRARKAQQYTKR